MMWHIIILGLIVCPNDPPVSSKAPPEAWQALKDISLALEIVGPHENWAADFNSELRYVRRHWRALQDAPPLSDCYWLPEPTAARDLCCFSEGFQAHLQMQRVIYPHRCEQITAVLNETRQLYIVWDAVRRANSPSESWALRRRMLLRLKETIGDNAYYNRQLPCWVPWWRFQEMTQTAKCEP
jgi:hypothetical protein